MKEIEQKADEIIKRYKTLLKNQRYEDDIDIVKQCAIQSVNHTIEVLNSANIRDDSQERMINRLLDEQIELKKILENRL